MFELFNWNLEEYESFENIDSKTLENSSPTILKHKYKFKTAEICMFDKNKYAYVLGTIYYRFDAFKIILSDKTITLMNCKFDEIFIINNNGCLTVNNKFSLNFKEKNDQISFLNYFNDYNNFLWSFGKTLCDKALNIIGNGFHKNELKIAILNLLDMFPSNFFLSTETFNGLVKELCLKDSKFKVFFYGVLNVDDFILQKNPTASDELYKAISLILQFNEIVSEKFNIDYSYMNIITYLLLIESVTHMYSNEWSAEVDVLDNFNNDEEYITYCYRNCSIVSEDEGALCRLAYHLNMKNKIKVFDFSRSLERIKKILDKAKSNTQKDDFINNIFKDRNISTLQLENNITIDDVDLMTGSEFELFIAQLFRKMGYSTQTTKASGDQGVDVIAERNGVKFGIQCKCYSNTVSNSAIQEVVAGKQFYHLDKVIVVTNSCFTKSAEELARANDVILWDRIILKEKLLSFNVNKH